MLPNKFTLTSDRFNYEFVYTSSKLIISATDIKKYFQWMLEIEQSRRFELLTHEIISDIFHDYSLNQLNDNTKIIFPVSYDKDTDSIPIAIIIDV